MTNPPEDSTDRLPEADATRIYGDEPQPPRRAAGEPGTPAERLLGGRYRLEGIIGRGGMAEVHRAFDTRLGRQVAVKELRADLSSDPSFQARFRREAQSAAGLNHPTIVAVYDTGEDVDDNGLAVPYIVMELVEGHTLRDVLRDGRKILPERALEITAGVLDALDYSHRAGIIHRDIKPANVMLTAQGNVKVMDFGIARAVTATSASMTQTAAVIGTAQYLSPEQARGETVDARSDIYSAGCLLYELLTSRPPFVGESPVSVAYQHVRELPVPPSQLDPLITPDIDAIVLTALAKDPAERFQSAREMSEDINRALAGQEMAYAAPTTVLTPTPAVPLVEEPLEEERPRRVLPAVLVLLALLVVGMLGVGWWFLNKTDAPTSPAQVTVPRVLGEYEASARNKLTDAHLTPKVVAVTGPNDKTLNTVLKQTPESGRSANLYSEVVIEVNQGPNKVAIPTGLMGKDKDDAIRQLSDAGFKNVDVSPAVNEPITSKKDQVLKVDPGEGQAVLPDAKITLNYATGKSKLPDWKGYNKQAVTQEAEKLGFSNVTFTEKDTTNAAEVNTVLSTDPAAGAQVDRGAKITVSVGRAVKPSPSPSPSPTMPTMPTVPPFPSYQPSYPSPSTWTTTPIYPPSYPASPTP